MIGEVFGRLVVLERLPSDSNGNAFWNCLCECGLVVRAMGTRLRSGKRTSCGCKRSDLIRERFMKHGHASNWARTREYITWCNMIRRCTQPSHPQFANYGGRGIDLDPRWLEFRVYFEETGFKPKGKSLDRIENNRGYWPGNVRWATSKTQNNNTRPRRTKEQINSDRNFACAV